MEKVAPALIYDATIVGDFALRADRRAAVPTATQVVDGGTTSWLTTSADAVAAALPAAGRRTLAGQLHNVDPDAIAAAIREFLTA
jgi:hypothetical protein